MSVLEEYRRRLAEWSDIQDHMPFLHETVLSYANPVVIELGVRSGNSTSALLSAATLRSGHLYSCDLAEPDVPATWYDPQHWSFTRGHSTGPEVLAAMPDVADVVFIDSSHDFDHTLLELFVYVPRVRPCGVVLLHDTQWMPPGGESLPETGGPVTEALHAFCIKTGRTWKNRHSEPGWFGLGVIRC